MNACDRLVRDYYVIEEASNVEPEIINVKSITYDGEAGETAMTPIPGLLLKEPDVLAFTDLPDGKMIDNMMNLARDHELPVFTRIPGKGAIDATLRMMVQKPDRKKFTKLLSGVVCMRLVRKAVRILSSRIQTASLLAAETRAYHPVELLNFTNPSSTALGW